nr:hypothetical protein [Tanacetum cinerariifolium]
MANITFIDQHNMVACLERTNRNAVLHQRVDFITTNPIHYALTISPTIYASYIEQFWATSKSKTVNDVKQIHATVDGKIVVISESSVRSDLHLMMRMVFINMKRQNKDFSGTVIPLFASMLVPQVVEGEGSGQPFEPQPPSLTTPPSHEETITTVASQLQKTHTPKQTKRGQDTKIPQSSGPHKKVGDEAVYTGEADRVVMDPGAKIPHWEMQMLRLGFLHWNNQRLLKDLVIKKLQKKVKRLEKKQRARTPYMNLFKIGTFRRQSLDKENVSKQERNLKTMLMFEEGDIDDNRDDINDMMDEAMKNVEGDTVNAAGTVNTATTGVSAASASVTTASVSISIVEPRTPPITITTIFEDEDCIISQTLVKMRSEKAKEKGVAFRDVKESTKPTKILPTIDPRDKRKGIMQEPEKPTKNPRIAQIQLDKELAKRMHEEEMVEFKKRQSEIAATEEASRAAIKAVINQELDDIQAMIKADEQMASRLQSEEQEQFTIKEKSRMLVEMIAKRKRFFTAQRAAEQRMVKDNGKKNDRSNKQAGSRKKRESLKLKPNLPKKLKVIKEQESAEDEQEKEELKLCLMIVQDEDRAINYETGCEISNC